MQNITFYFTAETLSSTYAGCLLMRVNPHTHTQEKEGGRGSYRLYSIIHIIFKEANKERIYIQRDDRNEESRVSLRYRELVDD